MAKAKTKSVVLANNDLIYLWWSLPKKIDNCLGFSIHRIVDNVEEPTGLYATVGFNKEEDSRKSPQTTDEWPIQSFNWKDLYAPHNKEIKYKIYPMIGTWDNLEKDEINSIITESTKRTQEYGEAKVIFNRGILSTQAFAKSGKKGKTVTKAEAKEFITNPSSIWRERLGGQMLFNVNSFFKKASENGGKYYAALYELTDDVLIKELTKNKGTEIILSNANKSETKIVNGKEKTITINDGTNETTRMNLHSNKKIKVYDRMLGSHIGHNKFVIYVDNEGTPQSILTGSTNWTPTGLCGQTNNMIIINSEKIATQYKDYWDQMKLEYERDEKQGADFREWCASNSTTNKMNKNANLTLWFSPNTVQKSKPKNPATPIDMQAVFDLIEKAKESVLYLVFNPGSPSIIDKIKEVASKRPEGKPLFVRGAVSDAKIAKSVTTNIVSSDILEKPATYYFDRVTGVAAIPGPFSYFEGELLKLGFSTIHDKLLVIDPFSDDCVVITGSHNLGYAASYKNDENMLIIKKDKAIAQAYATHVLDIVNHFKWRYKLQDKILKAGAKTLAQKEVVLKKEWNDLSESDEWMDYYFDETGFINRDRFIF
jgi:phosphatidylserine/phosphatidylglycerophosphate/cardiolipin synthase-like enzyme